MSMCMSNSTSNAVQYSSTRRAQGNMKQSWALPSSTAQHRTAQHSTAQHSTARALPSSTAQHSIARHTRLIQYILGSSTEQGEQKEKQLSAWPATSHHCLQQFGAACFCSVSAQTQQPLQMWYLLCIVVPAAFGSVTEDEVQHKGCVENIKLAAVPIAMVSEIVLRHLHPHVTTLAE